MLIARLAAALVAVGLSVALASAQDFPTRPVRLIIPTVPGGSTDVAARILAEATKPFLGQDIVVENKPGGSGTVAATLLTQARPDGYTIAAMYNGPLTAFPHTLKVSYTPESYEPIISFSNSTHVMCAAPDFPANDTRELLDHLKANPNKYTVGNDGIGGTVHLSIERVFQAFGVKVRAVPFALGGEQVKNFLGGHVTFYSGGVPGIQAYMKAGQAKCLLQTSAKDNAQLPQAFGLAKLGIAERETPIWRAIIAPKGTPPARMAVIEQAFRKGIATPRFQEFLTSQGEGEVGLTGDELKKLIRSEYESFGKLAEELGIKKQ